MTRFNLATPGREFAIRNKPGWLEERFRLFEQYCLPSVIAQTNQNFHWIIYFDENTPDEYKARVETLSGSGAVFTPYYTGLFTGDGWGRSIHECLAPAQNYVLTTRLDNDDSLANDFVERLHNEVRARNMAEGAYNFFKGAICQGDKLYDMTHKSAAFFSLLEPLSDTLCTAPNIQHMHMAEGREVFQIGGRPAWMQIVHDTNVSNRVRGQRAQPDLIRGLFPQLIYDQIRPVSTLEIRLDRHLSEPIRSARDSLFALVRRKRRVE